MDILDEFGKFLEGLFEVKSDSYPSRKANPNQLHTTRGAAAQRSAPVRVIGGGPVTRGSGHSHPSSQQKGGAVTGSGATFGMETPTGKVTTRQVTMASDFDKDSPTGKAIKDAAKASKADARAAKKAAGGGRKASGASLDAQIAGAAAMMQKIKGLNKVGDKKRTDTVVTFNK